MNYGDLDGDGAIKLADVVTLNKFLLNLEKDLSDQALENADVDRNDKVDALDALYILQCVIDLISPSDLPIQ